MRRAVTVLCTIAATTVASGAQANGRFPYANHLVVDPSDAKHVVVRTTYGVIQTFDSGASWRWFCEKAGGYGGVFDPAIDVTASGRLLVGLFDGLSSSTDRGCNFARATSPLDMEYVIDLVVDPKDPTHAFALTSSGVDGGFHVIVAESADSGATWKQAGVPLPSDFNSETLEVAPSKSDRIYASGIVGVSPRQGFLEKTDDRGNTWERLPIALDGAKAPYLAAVDPRDPDRLYVRVDGDSDGTTRADRLLFSADGGKTWSEIGGTNGDLFGFALSPDGTKVAYGGPKDGIFVASTSDHAFARVSTVGARCLRWTAAGLYACANEYPDGFTVGLSKDEGKTFQPLNHLSQLEPLECAASSSAAVCAKDWPLVQDTIGQERDAGVVDAGATQPPAATPAASSGCAASTSTAARGGSAVLALFALFTMLRRRR